jgi:autotransporter-associated beta strand protein
VNRALTLGGTNGGSITGIIQDTSSTNTHSVVKIGDGTWTLGGTNTYTSATTVQQGNLVAGSNSLSGQDGAFGNATSEINLGVAGANDNAGILIGGAFNVGRNVRLLTSNTTDAGTRVLTIGGNTAHNSEFSGNIILGTDSQAGRGITLTAANGGQVTFSGVIQNPTSMDATTYTVTKAGLGTVVLSNTNTYTGATTVSAGTLLVNGSTSSSSAVTVASGGTLGGSGTIGGAATVNGALNPGASPGVLAFASSLALGAGSTTTMEINGPVRGSEYDGLNVATTLALGGALVFDFGAVFSPNITFNLFDVAGGTSGAFSSVSLQGLMGAGSFAFDSSDVWSLVDGGNAWTFTQSTGDLNLAVIPEPATALLGCLGLFALLRRRRTP